MPRGIPNDPAKQRDKAAKVPPQAPFQEQPGQIPAEGFALPEEMKGQRGAVLLLDACNVYGINPDTSLPIWAGRGLGPFRELLAWKFYPGQESAGIPDSVALVTVGGVKIRYHADPDYPMDPDMETRLRLVFHAFKMDPKTNEVMPLPLPEDLTLPRSAVSSQGNPNAGHQYRGGYLRRAANDSRNG